MVQELGIFTVAVAVGFFVAVAFYESLATRDVLVARSTRLVRRVTQNRVAVGAAYLLTVVAFIPILVALWAIVLERALVAVGAPDPVQVAQSAVAIVAAARLLAYIREKTSHELAKAIPLALVFSLLIGGVAQLEGNLQGILDEPWRSDLTIELIAYLVALEIGLRLVNDSFRAVAGAVTRRRHASPTQPGSPDASGT